MSIEVIEILTKQFAKHRTAVITEAAQMQAEIDEIHRRPDTERRLVGHAPGDGGLEIEPGAAHESRPFVRNMYTRF